ncbi:MAG: ABC transporter ATP-binding protein [Coriobacteriales bacterium]|jgi:ATP-binding cassette subfamily B multidrug efflux pump
MADFDEKKDAKRPPQGPPGHGPGGLDRPSEKAHDPGKTFRRLVAYLKPEIPKILLVFLFAIVGTCFDVFAPKQLGNATTTVFNGAMSRMQGTGGVDFDLLRQILVIVFALYFGSSLFTYLQTFVMARVTQNVVYRLRQDTEEKLNRIPLSFYDSHSKGDILSRVVNDIDLISSTLQDAMTQLISAVITIVGVLVMMLVISPLMTLIALVVLALSAVITVLVARQSQKLYLAQQTALGVLDAHIEETYGGHTEVVAFTHTDSAVSEFDRVNKEYFGHAWRAQFASGLIRPLTNFVGDAAYVAVCVLGASEVLAGHIAVGDIQAFTQYLRNFTRPISMIASIINTIQSTLAGAERVFQLMDEPELSDETGLAVRDEPCRGEVDFEHVRFSYIPGTPVIKDFSVHVDPGETVAIVGPTGAGKSTLVNLLMRFYEIDSGQILLDGIDTRSYTRHDLRSRFGMVLQDTWLFNGTVKENIAYGVDDATDEEIERVAKVARVDDFIRTLPDGYGTVINEEASNISAGQRQLITIARALLANPAIMILDEATSSIDTRTERLVQQAMAELMAGRTSFVIAHRLSTIREADVILVIREGDIVEQGTHDELLAKGGFYAELYNSQFSECVDEFNE